MFIVDKVMGCSDIFLNVVSVMVYYKIILCVQTYRNSLTIWRWAFTTHPSHMHIHTDTHIHQTLSVLMKFLYVILSLVCILYTTNVRAQARTVGLSFCVLQFKLVCRNILLQTHKLTHTRVFLVALKIYLTRFIVGRKEKRILTN